MSARRPLKKRFELVLLSVTGVLLVLVAATMIVVRYRDQKQLLEQNALMFAETTNDQICQQYRVYYHSGSYKFREIVRRTMSWNPDVRRVLILSVDGHVLYDSSESMDYNLQAERPPRRIEDSRIVDATAELGPQVFHDSDARLGNLLLIVSPFIEEWGRHPYSVLYVFTYRSLDAAVRAAALPVAALLSGSLIIMAVVARGLGTRVARPIEELTRRVRSFEEGRRREIAVSAGSLEIDELSDTFDRMATRLEEHVQKLESANEELKTLDRLKTDLLANVSHELRTPLSAIRGYVEFMSDGNLGPVSAEQGRALSICLRNIDRLNKNINMLLDFSRMELGRVAINPAPFRLDLVLRQTLASLEADVRKKKVTVEPRIAEPLPPVVGDRDRLVQVFENLVVNAIKFTPPGGKIWVAAEPDAGGREVRISVADSGIGIAGPERERIFAKFYQVEAGAARRFGGVGLGLAIVKSILDAHHVAIQVEDRPGGGTVFRFALPVAPGRVSHPELPAGDPSRETRPVRILAVDDDADFLSYLVDALRGDGREVLTAATADQGLATARAEKPDLILLDVFLPDRNGFDVLQALKSDPETRAIPTLLVTVVNEKAEGFRLGAYNDLMKPVQGAALVEAVETALAPRDSAGATILVVDDEPDVTSYLAAVLSARGYRTVAAASGAEALEAAAHERPDLVILDVMMPGMTGWEVLRRLRESSLASVPVIVLSARENPQDVAEGLQLG
ncbi:MAG TPA: response regulator, partial [Thermoanaerobaculia bacterium]|nr:response regulator [Thermoanaerobaculia bacterium]